MSGHGMWTYKLLIYDQPVMDGLTCTRKIRELEKGGKFVRVSIGNANDTSQTPTYASSQHVPIIAVTANARSEQIETALSAGMDAVQPKPFRIPELMERMFELREKMGLV